MMVEEAEDLLQQRRLASAWDAFNAAEAAGEDVNRCSGGRWMVSMLRGELDAAWQESDAMRARGSHDPHRVWNGESLRDQRVIVRCLHGFGDAVQMLRYAPALNVLARDVVWEVAPRLVELASRFQGVSKVITWGEAAPALAPEWDAQVEVMELPHLFRTTQASLPIAERYCTVATGEDQTLGVDMGEGRGAVGVVWSAGEWNPARSVPFSTLRPLFNIPSVTFWNLQGGEATRDAGELPHAMRCCGEGLMALAATIAKLDLVVTVDTLAAHLAGAMGKPVWVMLQKEADWRWLAEGDRSAWYPTMRLFRQERSGDWSGVINTIGLELMKELA